MTFQEHKKVISYKIRECIKDTGFKSFFRLIFNANFENNRNYGMQ